MTADPSVTAEPLSGIVLAGGKARRLGMDKARIVLPDGRPLIAAVSATLHALCVEVVVVVDTPGRFADLELPGREATDVVAGRGPIGGLHAGLPEVRQPFAVVVACDMPFLSPALLAYMAGRPRTYQALVPRLDGRWHPTHAIYSRACLPFIERALAEGENRLTALLSRLEVQEVTADEVRQFDSEGLCLLSLNEPEDLERAEATWRRGRSGRSARLRGS